MFANETENVSTDNDTYLFVFWLVPLVEVRTFDFEAVLPCQYVFAQPELSVRIVSVSWSNRLYTERAE